MQDTRENNRIVDEIIVKYQPQKQTDKPYLHICQQIHTKAINMAKLSLDTNKTLKRKPNISSEDSKWEIRENVERLRNYWKQVAQEEVQGFIQALSTIFDCTIRRVKTNMKT